MWTIRNKVVASLVVVMAAGAATVAQANLIGFDYLLHVRKIDTFGAVPADTLTTLAPIKVGTAAHGSMYFHSDLTATNISATHTIYSDIFPLNGAGYINFHVPNRRFEGTFPQIILQVLNDEPVASGITDALLVRLGGSGTGAVLPGFEDPRAAGVDAELTIALDSVGAVGQFLSPFNSTALPLSPPRLSDFNRSHQWNLIMQRAGSTAQPGWGIILSGEVVALSPSSTPEPSSLALLLAATGAAAAFSRKRSKTAGQSTQIQQPKRTSRARRAGAMANPLTRDLSTPQHGAG